MSTADRIVQESRVRKRRFDAAISAVELLSLEQRKELIVELLDRVESETRNTAQAVSPEIRRKLPVIGKPKKTDMAEALVLKQPGMSTSEIGAVIEQKRPAADCTLRQVAKLRGTIKRRDGRWYPTKPPGGSDPAAN